MSKKVTSQLRPHVEPPTRTQLVTPSLPWKRGSPSTIHLPNDSISLIGARASTSDGRPTDQSPKAEAHPFFQTGFGSERGEGRGRPTDKTIEKNLDNGHLRNSSRGREGACAVERGINQEEELVASIQPTIGHTSHSNEIPLSLPVSLFSLIPPQAETFICLRTA